MTTLLVCSAGGHLKQLHSLQHRFELDDDVVWVTFETGLSRSLLAGQDVVYVDHIEPRDIKPVMAAAHKVHRLIGQRDVRRVISTGAGIAMSAIPELRARGGRCHYIESSARVTGPSLTGRLLTPMPGVNLYTQYPSWQSKRWQYRGSVYDGFESFTTERTGRTGELRRVVVILGTITTYGFRRLVERLVAILPSNVEVLWQTSTTDVSGLGIDARPQVAADELGGAITAADVVVSHAGNGTAITCLEAGRIPVLVPRRKQHGEHVDEHQVQIARELSRRELAVTVDADDLSLADLERAALMGAKAVGNAPPFELSE